MKTCKLERRENKSYKEMEKEIKKVRTFMYKNDEKNGRSPIKR